MAKDNVNVAWHLIEGKVRRSSGSIADVAPGDGRIVDVAGSKAAVHRDADGAIHAVSAACTHLGCTVAWNAAERSWDCPCHGSRFAVDGTVLHGPATEPLEAIDVEAGARG
jgi:Rieske Fe-S protein